MKKDKNSDHNNYYEGIRREQKNKKVMIQTNMILKIKKKQKRMNSKKLDI